MTVKLGVIADDFTGATDIAGFMVQNGWKVVQLLNEPDENTPVPQDVDAIVISLKAALVLSMKLLVHRRVSG